MASPTQKPLRVVVEQPALPSYRVPVFRELASRSEMILKVAFAEQPNIPNAKPDGFAGEFIPMRGWRFFGRRLTWHSPQWTYANASKTDVLVLYWNVECLSLVPSLLRARATGVRTVLWGHGYSKREARWRQWIRRQVARLGDALLFYNHGTAARFRDEWGWPPERLHVALNSLDQTPIQQARRQWLDNSPELARFRDREDLHGGPIILFVSRLDRDNRVDLLLRATAELRGRSPTLTTVIIGTGPDEDRLRRLTVDLRLNEHVRFLGAIYAEEQLAPWFLLANVFCYPANIGLSLLHAFGYGLPVVTSDRTEAQNPEIEALRWGENGLLYRDGDVPSLVEALRTILEDPDLRDRLSNEALRTVMERFSLERMVDGFEAAVRGSAK